MSEKIKMADTNETVIAVNTSLVLPPNSGNASVLDEAIETEMKDSVTDLATEITTELAGHINKVGCDGKFRHFTGQLTLLVLSIYIIKRFFQDMFSN